MKIINLKIFKSKKYLIIFSVISLCFLILIGTLAAFVATFKNESKNQLNTQIQTDKNVITKYYGDIRVNGLSSAQSLCHKLKINQARGFDKIVNINYLGKTNNIFKFNVFFIAQYFQPPVNPNKIYNFLINFNNNNNIITYVDFSSFSKNSKAMGFKYMPSNSGIDVKWINYLTIDNNNNMKEIFMNFYNVKNYNDLSPDQKFRTNDPIYNSGTGFSDDNEFQNRNIFYFSTKISFYLQNGTLQVLSFATYYNTSSDSFCIPELFII